ncbi:MAG: sugar ABC transporter permease [Limnochordaceae bacterium]|nr:sugar ABC transporter permease [Limnochordaceae bacterium]
MFGRAPGEILRLIVVLGAGLAVLEGAVWLLAGRLARGRYRVLLMLVMPALVGTLAFIIYPFVYEVYIAFSNMSLRHFREFDASLAIGLENLVRVFTQPVLQRATFFELLGRTVVWTGVNVFFHVAGGLGLAVLLNRPMRGRNLYRTLLVLPWAIPQVVAVLAWRNEFNYQYGFVNALLRTVGLPPISWLSDPFWAFVAMIWTNVWLGIPFMMTIFLGGLQAIPGDLYDAADIDGATGWQKFRRVVIPLLQPVMTPAVILGVVWTFNNFSVVYLFNQGAPVESTHILVTALYRAAFDFYRYGFGAMYALVLFVFLLLFSVIYVRMTGVLGSVTR